MGRVVVLWAAPRSVSTAFEKAFSRRPSTRIVHEPFTDCYYFSENARSRRYGRQPDRLGYGPAAAIDEIYGCAAPLVFVKDLAFQAEPYVPDEFLAAATNTFIVRRPRVVLRSLRGLKPDFTEEEFGFEPLARLLRHVVEDLSQEPVVVEGDRFREAPEVQLRRYCERIGVDFDSRMLSWPDGRIRAWAPHERESQAKWHRTLETSTRIIPPEPAGHVDIRPEEADVVRRAEKVYAELQGYML
ncbi:sulfotransferase-like domain-containing protein [Virgisporangium aurantiacum]|uniref:Sulfotransferase family protein n=1 Tax=Virgisporangium aurantiacum TaxID=175570 RepID=A0A8J3ZIR7_9ACTN|nr:hypothetical protein [Virgisporangium aurantiacum]GIJ64862.1 hypothetical protein Vau01_123780 [Virgisporangium aurantiacum]